MFVTSRKMHQAIAVLAAALVGGCSYNPTGGVVRSASLNRQIDISEAFITPPPGGPAVIAVLENRYVNGLAQDILDGLVRRAVEHGRHRAEVELVRREAQVGLQVAHLLGDGGVAYVQERARPGDRPGFRIGGKGAQGGQRGQAVPVFHVSSTYTLSGFLTRMRAP